MKAVILASGVGSRIRSVVPHLPKPLVPVAGVPLLGRMLETLRSLPIDECIVTTGFRAEAIEEYVRCLGMLPFSVRTVLNERFEETNYIYSLWLARDMLVGEDVLLVHGDMLCDPALVARLATTKDSAVLVQRSDVPSPKDFNARLRNGKVVEVAVRIGGDDVHPCMPLYQWRADDFARWMASIDAFVSRGDVRRYAEDAFNVLEGALPLIPVWYGDELCMEVDDGDDLERAEGLLRAIPS